MGAAFGLESVTAVALGGIQLTGSIGSILGVVTGALSLGLITNGINLLGISPFLRGAITGALLLVAVCAAQKGGGAVTAGLTSTAPAPTVPRARRWAAALLALPPAYAGLAVLLLLAAVMRPQLLSAMLLPLIARQAAPLGLAVIGQSLVMRGRSIDLSSGGVIVAVSYLLTSGYFPISDAVAMACVALGLVVGVVNGALIVKARASSMIVTLATSMILTGCVVALSQQRAPATRRSSCGSWHGCAWGAFRCRCWCGWRCWCRRCCCCAARCSAATWTPPAPTRRRRRCPGIPHLRVIFIGHVASALISVLCGFILVGFVGKGSITLGQDLALNSLAAAILGGVNFGSGRGGMAGAAAAFMLDLPVQLSHQPGPGRTGPADAAGRDHRGRGIRLQPEPQVGPSSSPGFNLEHYERRNHQRPGAEPFFFKGNDIGVLVCHGFTGTTQSMRYLGEQLHGAGYGDRASAGGATASRRQRWHAARQPTGWNRSRRRWTNCASTARRST